MLSIRYIMYNIMNLQNKMYVFVNIYIYIIMAHIVFKLV